MKICTKCKNEKLESDFYVDRSHKDGLSYYCIDCARKRGRDFYYNNSHHRTKIVARNKANRIVLKEYVVTYLQNHPCIDCGESDIRCLDFDHRSDKFKNISKILQESLSLNVLINEIGKCDIRCANCHRKKTAIDFNWYKNV